MYNPFSKIIRKSEATIEVAKFLASNIGSRDIVDVLQDQILNSNSSLVILDFKNVNFVSRSAAHEFLLIQEKLRQEHKEIIFNNLNNDISEMIRVVAANRAAPKSNKSEFNPEKTDINTLLQELSVL